MNKSLGHILRHQHILATLILVTLLSCALFNCAQHLVGDAAPLNPAIAELTNVTLYSENTDHCKKSDQCQLFDSVSAISTAVISVLFSTIFTLFNAIHLVSLQRSRHYWRFALLHIPAKFNYPRLHLKNCVLLN